MIDDNAQNKRINPGVSVNRPRYTVKFIFVIIIALLCKWLMKADEDVVLFETDTELKVKAKEPYNVLKDKAEFYYVGAHVKRTALGDTVPGYQRLMSRMYRKVFPNQNAEVISKHFRTEYVFQQRLEDLDKYTDSVGKTIVADEFGRLIYSDSSMVSTSPVYKEFIASAREFFAEQRLDDSESDESFTQGLSPKEKA